MTEETVTATAPPTTAIPVEDVEASKAKAPAPFPDACDRPDRQVLDNELAVHDEEIEKCKAVLDEVKTKMDKLHGEMNVDKGKDGVRTKLNELRAATKVFADERKGFFDLLDKNKAVTAALREKSDAMQKQLKDVAGVKDFSTAAVEKKIRDLDYYLSTTPLDLKEEKEVIGQIKALNASKKMIAGYDVLQTQKETANTERKGLSAKLDDNKKSFSVAKALEDAQWDIVKKAGNKDADKKDVRKSLLEKREKARASMNEHYAKIRDLRDKHRKGEDAWRKYMNAKRNADRERYLKEEEERKEERKLEKLQDEEEKEESNHATKLVTIDQMIYYLSKFTVSEATAEVEVEKVVVEMDGLKQMGKKAMDFDDDIFGTKKAKNSKKHKKGKKGGVQGKSKGISHDVKSMQEMEGLSVKVPMTIEDVAGSLASLKEKRDVIIKEKESRKVKREAKIATVEAAIESKNAKKAEEAEVAEEPKEDAAAAPADDAAKVEA